MSQLVTGRKTETTTATRILLIEDDADTALWVELLLRSEFPDADVVIADTLGAGVDIVLNSLLDGSARFDCILCDLGLPDAGGLDAVTMMAPREAVPPVVVLTSADDDLAAKALRLGAQDYLTKGELEARQLSRVVRFAIERHRHRHRLAEEVAARALETASRRRGRLAAVDARTQLTGALRALTRVTRPAAEDHGKAFDRGIELIRQAQAALSLVQEALEDDDTQL